MSPVRPLTEEVCDGARFREGLADATTLLERRVNLLDALNVFPVPDGDTGTNLARTMRAAIEAARACSSVDVAAVSAAVARGALMGARGNSGVILSQYLRGIAGSLEGRRALDARAFARALEEGSATARAALDQPVEGTMLTVARDAAREATRAVESGSSLSDALDAVAVAARISAERTRGALPVLRQADVVDAGALGLATILEGLARSIRGDPLPDEPLVAHPRSAALDVKPEAYGFCTEFVIRGADLDPDRIHRELRAFGDCVLAVGDSSIVRVHVHTFTPDDVMGYGSSLGHVDQIKVDDMQDQNRRLRDTDCPPTSRRSCGLLVLVDGDGFAELFRSLGAVVVADSPMVVGEVVRVVRSGKAAQWIVLLDDPLCGAELRADLLVRGISEAEVTVRATGNPARGVAASLAFRSDCPIDPNIPAIDRALAGIRSARITRPAAPCPNAKDQTLIGLLDDGTRLVGGNLAELSVEILNRLDASSREVITLYHGRAIVQGDLAAVLARVRCAFPDQQVDSIVGGQSRDLICLSCE